MMNTMTRFTLAIVTIFILSSSRSEAQQHATYVFTHVNVVPMDTERVLTDYSVSVRDGMIRDMGPSSSVTVPEGATEIDARGKFMIPALSDMHVHLEGDAWNIGYPPGT